PAVATTLGATQKAVHTRRERWLKSSPIFSFRASNRVGTATRSSLPNTATGSQGLTAPSPPKRGGPAALGAGPAALTAAASAAMAATGAGRQSTRLAVATAASAGAALACPG